MNSIISLSKINLFTKIMLLPYAGSKSSHSSWNTNSLQSIFPKNNKAIFMLLYMQFSICTLTNIDLFINFNN